MNATPRHIAATVGLAGALVAALTSQFVARADADVPAADAPRQAVVVVLGAAGGDEFAAQFRDWADLWRQAAERAAARFTLIGGDEPGPLDDRTRLQQYLAQHASIADAPLWIVLIGHGSFDGETAKFNFRGPDAAAQEFAAWLAAVKSPVAFIDCTSASAPFINALSAEGRVVIAATKSGFELNFARFGQYLAQAVADPRADLDKDDQTSLLEAYLTACRDVAEFYAGQQRLASEHALLDDNGDGLGTPAEWFRGIRATRQAQAGAALDGLRAHQLHLVPSDREARLPLAVRRRRDELELAIAALRAEKPQLAEDEYYRRLETLLVELARLYAEGAAAPLVPPADAPATPAPPPAPAETDVGL